MAADSRSGPRPGPCGCRWRCRARSRRRFRAAHPAMVRGPAGRRVCHICFYPVAPPFLRTRRHTTSGASEVSRLEASSPWMVLGMRPFAEKRPKVTSKSSTSDDHARRQQTARADQRIPAPIQKPRITGDDGASRAAPHHKSARSQRQLPPKGVVLREIRPGARPAVSAAWRLAEDDSINSKAGGGMSAERTTRHAFSRSQRQVEPARTVGVAVRDLSAALFHRMRNALAPFGLGMVDAARC